MLLTFFPGMGLAFLGEFLYLVFSLRSNTRREKTCVVQGDTEGDNRKDRVVQGDTEGDTKKDLFVISFWMYEEGGPYYFGDGADSFHE